MEKSNANQFKIRCRCKDERIIFEIEKMKKTDVKYPRKTGIPAKKPL